MLNRARTHAWLVLRLSVSAQTQKQSHNGLRGRTARRKADGLSAARRYSVSCKRLAPAVSRVVLEGRHAVQKRNRWQLLPHCVLFCADAPNNVTTGDNVFSPSLNQSQKQLWPFR